VSYYSFCLAYRGPSLKPNLKVQNVGIFRAQEGGFTNDNKGEAWW